jgi:hypothetical protein
MQPSDRHHPTGNAPGAVDLAMERTVQATQLLREALTLLGSEPQRTLSRATPDRLRLPEVQRLTVYAFSHLRADATWLFPALSQGDGEDGDLVRGSGPSLDRGADQPLVTFSPHNGACEI